MHEYLNVAAFVHLKVCYTCLFADRKLLHDVKVPQGESLPLHLSSVFFIFFALIFFLNFSFIISFTCIALLLNMLTGI